MLIFFICCRGLRSDTYDRFSLFLKTRLVFFFFWAMYILVWGHIVYWETVLCICRVVVAAAVTVAATASCALSNCLSVNYKERQSYQNGCPPFTQVFPTFGFVQRYTFVNKLDQVNIFHNRAAEFISFPFSEQMLTALG